MYVSKIPDSAKYVGKDLFDNVFYYETSRFVYSFYVLSKKILRSHKNILDEIEIK